MDFNYVCYKTVYSNDVNGEFFVLSFKLMHFIL